MSKKSGFIFLGLGLLSLALYGIYNYIDSVNHSSPSNDITSSIDYVKSHDINKKTKVSFPIDEKLTIVDYSSDDFYKYYSNNDDFFLTAAVYDSYDPIDEYALKQYDSFKSVYVEREKKVTTSDISCQHLCQRYQVFEQDGSILVDELKVYIKISNEEIFDLSYHLDNQKMQEEFINKVINNINISYDANYSFAELNGDQLSINLKVNNNNKTLKILLNNNLYEEVISGYNSVRMDRVKKKNTDGVIFLIVKLKKTLIELVNELDMFYSTANKKEIQVGNMKAYEYDFELKKSYAIIVSDEIALLIESQGENIIDINDFKNIIIEDV